jgi:hypothetical protein
MYLTTSTRIITETEAIQVNATASVVIDIIRSTYSAPVFTTIDAMRITTARVSRIGRGAPAWYCFIPNASRFFIIFITL